MAFSDFSFSTFFISADDNECLEENGGCSDICENADGTYACFCYTGYSLLPDNHNCSGIFL